MVLYIHACFKEAASFPVASYLQGFLQFSGLSIVANPLFFAISGFLFFYGMAKVEDCYPKIKKRIRTLLIPYIIWNFIFVLWYVVLKYTPGVSSFVNSNIIEMITEGSMHHRLKVFFIDPIAFQLWFLRDLIIYVLLTPLFYLLLKRTKLLLLVLLFIIATLALIYLSPKIKVWGCFFFVLGGYLAIHSSLDRIARLSPWIVWGCAAIYFLNAILRPLKLIPLNGTDVFVEVCGLIFVWRVYDYIVKDESNRLIRILANLGGYCFFIYLFHEPAFNIIKKLGIKLLGVNEVSLIILYLICPWIMFYCSIGVAKLWKKFFPSFYSICVGGRTN